MASEFKLSYTGAQINSKLSKIDSLASKSELPTKTSDLSNDSGFITKTYVQEYAQPVGDYALQADYIKNRTHWAEDPVITTETVLSETTVEFVDGECTLEGYRLKLVNNTEYVVTYDGVDYPVVATEVNMGLNAIIFGNPVIFGMDENPEDNGQPFAAAYIPDQFVFAVVPYDPETTACTISITRTMTTQKVHKMDDKYINADWTAQKSTISTEGLAEITMTVSPDGVTVPSEYLNMDALMEADYLDVTWNGEVYRCLLENVAGTLVIGNTVAIGLFGTNSGEPFCFMEIPGMGWTLLVSEENDVTFSITCYVSVPDSTIPDEFLPERLQFGHKYEAEVFADAITWDGDVTGRAVFNTYFYHVSSAVPTLEALSNGGVITYYDGNGTGETAFSVSNVVNSNDLTYQVGNAVFILTENVGMYGYTPGIYFLKQGIQYATSMRINDYAFQYTETKIKTIDPRYLPEDIGGGLPEVTTNDNGAFLRVINGRWTVATLPNAEDGEF